MASPRARGFFRAAIVQSAACNAPSVDPLMTETEGYEASRLFLDRLNLTEKDVQTIDARSLQNKIDRTFTDLEVIQGPNAAVDRYMLHERPTAADVSGAHLDALVWGNAAGDEPG